MTNKNIIDKYNKRAREINSLLCVGLDSDFDKIPEKFKSLEFPQFEFNKYIIEETHEFAAAYKPNSAFYEARGDKGIRELKMTMEYLQKNYSDIFTILDAKRGDIGNTNNGEKKKKSVIMKDRSKCRDAKRQFISDNDD